MKTRSAEELFKTMITSQGMKDFVQTYNVAATALLAVSTLSVIMMIIFNIVKMAKSADNAKERQEAISGLVICLIAFAVLGSIDVVYAIVVNLMLGNV